MATENVGGIEYRVDIDTAAMIKAEAVINKSLTSQVARFDAADKAVQRFATAQKAAGNSINALGQVIDSNGKLVVNATNQYRSLAKESVSGLVALKNQAKETFTVASTSSDLLKKNLEALANQSIAKVNASFDAMGDGASVLKTKLTGVNSAIKKVGSESKRSSFAAQNFSYQIQDIAVQAQMGISPAVIFAQQFPQMVVGMGAAAGAAGALVAIIGGLVTAMTKGKSTSEMLGKAIEQTKAVMTLGTDGVVEYTEKMKALYKVNEQLAKIKLAETIINQNEIIKSSSKAIVESAESTSKFYKSTFEDLRALTESVAKDIGGNMADVAEAIKSGQNIGDAGSYLNRDLDNIAKKFKITRDEALELGLAMSDVAKGGGAVAIKSLQNVTEDLSETYGYSNEKLTKLSSGLVEHFIASSQATDGINELRMALFDKGQAVDEDIEGNKKLVDTYKQLKQQMELERVNLEEGGRAAFAKSLEYQKLTDTQKENLLSLYDYNEGLNEQSESLKQTASDLEWYEQQLAKINAKDDQKTKTLTTQVQSIGLTPEQEIQARYDAEIELLRQAEEKKIEIEGTYAERRTQLEKERLESVKALQSENNEFLEAAFGNLDTQIAGTMASVVLGAQDGESALKSLATTILTQVVGAIIQQGIASVFASQTAAKGQTAANAEILATAAPTASAVSLATAGANSLPAVAGIAAVTAAMAGISSIAGAREFGGPVTAGKSYLVGERGPEMVTMGASGHVTSNKDLMGGSAPIVNVYGVPDSLGAPSVTMDDVTKAINIKFNKEISGIRNGTGQMSQALKSTTTNKNRATAR